MIKTKDKNHLVTIGHEGSIGTESLDLYETINADKNLDYLTIHIWPKNWGWFQNGRLSEGMPNVMSHTLKYIDENVRIAAKLNKPMVIEEFGLPRDGQSFDPTATCSYRDAYYKKILSFIGKSGGVAGANFWAFGGTARPIKGQVYWKTGDDRTGDPPMEEQGLNTVFDTDRSTWAVIRSASKSIGKK